jgi:hypothetical protein
MKFSLREAIWMMFAAAGVCGMITNNYWMEREVIRARAETKAHFEKLLKDMETKRKAMFNDLKKVDPKTAQLYEYDDECDCK